EPHHGEAGEDEDGAAGGEAVEPVAQVHAVGGGVDEQDRPDDPPDVTEVPAGRVPAGERQGGLDVGPGDDGHGEGDGHEQEAGRLGALRQAEVPLVRHLDPVVDEAHAAGADDDGHHEQAGAGEEEPAADVGGQVPHHRGGDD